MKNTLKASLRWAATSIRRLVVVALLPLGVAGCFEEEGVNLTVENSEQYGNSYPFKCIFDLVVHNRLDEPLEILRAVVFVNETRARTSGYYDFELGEKVVAGGRGGVRMMVELRGPSGCVQPKPKITKVRVVKCETTTRNCAEGVSF